MTQEAALIKTHTVHTTVNFYTVFKKALHGVEHLSKVPPEESRARHLRNDREAALGAVRVVLTPKPAPPVGYRLHPIAC